jgi:hypothetical protein
MIVLKCSSDVSSGEVEIARNVCTLLQIQPFYVDKSAGQDIARSVGGSCFNLVYLCGHGSISAFGDPGGGRCTDWRSVGDELRTAMCLNQGATVFCACCRGGLLTVAKALLETCPMVDFVCGPRSDIGANVLALGFHTVMYNIIFRQGDPIGAARLASEATGHQFAIHDRVDLADRGLV